MWFTCTFTRALRLRRPAQVQDFASKMLGGKLITKQTGPEGQLCSKVSAFPLYIIFLVVISLFMLLGVWAGAGERVAGY